MKKMYKVMALVLCAVLLVAGSVMGTLAYLQMKTDPITNTFTVGQVSITLDEADVDEYGVPVEGAGRVAGNEYKLIPGHTYTKDPTITVKEGSEKCWVFAKLENGLGEASEIITINATNWDDLGNGVYAYKVVLTAGEKATLFNKFKFAASADPDDYKTKSIVITAYAVQADGFNSAQAAWNATFGAANP